MQLAPLVVMRFLTLRSTPLHKRHETAYAAWHLYFCDIIIICLEESWFCEKMKFNISRIFPIGKHSAVK